MAGTLKAAATGLLAGVAGTAAMTATQRIEQSLTGRQDSRVPAQVGAKLTERTPQSSSQSKQMGTTVHWAHGISMGALRGILGRTSLSPGAASSLHFVLVWSGDALLYTALGITPPPWKWAMKDLVTDFGHKLVLSTITSAVYVAGRRGEPVA